jgi:exportin-5
MELCIICAKITVLTKLQRLPLNPTKNLLGATTEKLKDGSREYQIGAEVWGGAMQAVLPNLLQLARSVPVFSGRAFVLLTI